MNSLSPKTIGGSPVGLFLYVEDVDRIVNRVVAEGAKVLMEVEDEFWGDKYGSIEDPFGYQWSIFTHIKDLSEEEFEKSSSRSLQKCLKINQINFFLVFQL